MTQDEKMLRIVGTTEKSPINTMRYAKRFVEHALEKINKIIETDKHHVLCDVAIGALNEALRELVKYSTSDTILIATDDKDGLLKILEEIDIKTNKKGDKMKKEGLGFIDATGIPNEPIQFFKANFLKVSPKSLLCIETKNGLVLETEISNIIKLGRGDVVTSLAIKPYSTKGA